MHLQNRAIWWITGYAVFGFVFSRYVLDLAQPVSMILALSFGSMGYIFAPRPRNNQKPPADGPESDH